MSDIKYKDFADDLAELSKIVKQFDDKSFPNGWAFIKGAMYSMNIIVDKQLKDNKIIIEDEKREQYGMFNGYYKWDLTKDWFQMSNDDFFEKYLFNYNPHDDGDLYQECKEYLLNVDYLLKTKVEKETV